MVMGHKGQLQEVFINLIHNAIEAMDEIKDDRRVLQVIAEPSRGNAVVVAVETPDRVSTQNNRTPSSMHSSRQNPVAWDWD